jgi:hypothetical protein
MTGQIRDWCRNTEAANTTWAGARDGLRGFGWRPYSVAAKEPLSGTLTSSKRVLDDDMDETLTVIVVPPSPLGRDTVF